MTEEIWKEIPFAKGYQVSTMGRVRSFKGKNGTVRILKPKPAKNGYLYFNAGMGKFRKTVKIHRAVAITFLENTDNQPCVNHIDANKENNSIGNIEWCTVLYNTRHALSLGLNPWLKPVIDLTTGIFFDSVRSAAVAYNMKYTTLQNYLKGKRRNKTMLRYA